MTMRRIGGHLGLVVCAWVWAGVALAADGAAVWRDGFEEGQGAWRAYGDGCALEVSGEGAQAGQLCLRARFDDSSPGAWANKGAQIRFTPGIPWSSVRYLLLRYRLDHAASVVGYLLHDSAGNWWRTATEKPTVGQWAPAAVTTGCFGYAWNDDPNMPPGTKDAEIVELFIFAGTEEVNSGARYTLDLDDVSLCSALPEGLEAVTEAPAPEVTLPPEEGEPFALQWRVGRMDSRGYLTVDGKPFFPLGIYSCFGIDQSSGAHPESHFDGLVTEEKVGFWLRSIRDAGFNLLQTYTMQSYGMDLKPGLQRAWKSEDVVGPTTPERLREGTLRLLDLCSQHGLTLMAGSSPPYCAERLPAEAGARAAALAAWKERVRANVLAWKGHPALAAWYLIDEPSSVAFPAADMEEQYRTLKELDSEHPLVIASSAATDVQYARGLDVFAPDPYPIETGVPLRELPARIRPLRGIGSGTPPMPQTWAVIQICQWVEGRRLPSEAEMRLLALAALSQDVTGLLFYEFRNYPDGNPAHWASVGRVVRSLQSVIPALLAEGKVVRDLAASDRRVYSLGKQVGEGAGAVVWVIAANPSQNLAGEAMGVGKVSFALEGLDVAEGATAEALDEDGEGRFQPGGRRAVELVRTGERVTLRDEFGALAAHVYRIGLAAAGRAGGDGGR